MHESDACPPVHRASSGYVLLTVVFLVALLGSLALGLLQEGLAARAALDHHETSLKALEMAEVGVVRAEAEIRAQVDLDGGGIGNAAGTVANGSFEAAVQSDPVSADRWFITAVGRWGHSERRIEVGVRRRQNSAFAEALFAIEDLTLSNVTTDAYDSRLGTYASQRLDSDAGGPFALLGGDVGSNGDIYLDGTSVWVRGNAIPGPLRQTHLSGSPTVFGDLFPREFDMHRDPASYEEFEAAMRTNHNGTIQRSGGGNSMRYNAKTYDLTIVGNRHVQLEAGTYFFSELKIGAGSTLEFLGPSRVYVTGSLEVSSGANILAPSPADLRIFAHPYPLPSAGKNVETRVKVNGGSQVTWALYAPGATLEIGGGNDFYGAAVAWTVDLSGSNAFHYDKALGQVEVYGVAIMERLYWLDAVPPRR